MYPRRHTRVALRHAVVSVAETAAVALLLFVDFGLSAYFTQGKSETDIILAVASTFGVAMVVAVLALCRRVVSVAVTIAAAFAVSVAASITSAIIGTPGLSMTEVVALGVLTVYGVQHATLRGALVIAGAALAVATGFAALRIEIEPTPLLLAVLAWGCAIAAGAAARSLRGRRDSALEGARRVERMELARELHDVVAHQVTGIVVQAQAAIVVAQKNPDHAGRALASIEAAGTEALSGMRRMVGALRETSEAEDPVLTVPSGIGDVAALVERFDPSGDQVLLRMDLPARALPPGVGETAYRVVRECLTNLRQHAHASSSAEVSIRSRDAALEITVHNDGVRHRTEISSASRGFGLVGMGERVAALGGTLEAGPGDLDSWLVRVVLPTGSLR
jgi:signal transduction histidine kinase